MYIIPYISNKFLNLHGIVYLCYSITGVYLCYSIQQGHGYIHRFMLHLHILLTSRERHGFSNNHQMFVYLEEIKKTQNRKKNTWLAYAYTYSI